MSIQATYLCKSFGFLDHIRPAFRTGAFGLALTMFLGGSGCSTCCEKGAEPHPSPPPKEIPIDDEPVLTNEEQRAFRVEATLEADAQINGDNFEKMLLTLKKEIEADL